MDDLDFDDIQYYVRPSEKQGKTWEEVPAEIKETFDKLGIPEAEQKFLAGVSAQYESEVVYHSMQKDLEKQGVIFTDTDSAFVNIRKSSRNISVRSFRRLITSLPH